MLRRTGKEWGRVFLGRVRTELSAICWPISVSRCFYTELGRSFCVLLSLLPKGALGCCCSRRYGRCMNDGILLSLKWPCCHTWYLILTFQFSLRSQFTCPPPAGSFSIAPLPYPNALSGHEYGVYTHLLGWSDSANTGNQPVVDVRIQMYSPFIVHKERGRVHARNIRVSRQHVCG